MVDLLAHGADFFAVGTRTGLFAFGKHLDDVVRINLNGMMGPLCDAQSNKILQWVVKFNNELEYTWRGDERHVSGLTCSILSLQSRFDVSSLLSVVFVAPLPTKPHLALHVFVGHCDGVLPGSSRTVFWC